MNGIIGKNIQSEYSLERALGGDSDSKSKGQLHELEQRHDAFATAKSA